jgi:cell division protein FtsQ
MADTAAYGASVRKAKSLDAQVEPARRETGEAGRRALIVLIVILIPLIAGSLLLIFPAMRITRFDVAGDTTLSREEILRWTALHGTEYLATVDCARIAANLEAHPQVEKAEVRKVFPNGLRLVVTDRVAVAAVLASVDGRVAPVAIDKDGVAFGALPASTDVPVLSGIRFEGFRFGVRLPDSVLPVLKSLAAVRSANPALLSAFSEIRLVRRTYGDIELMLYPLQYRVPVRTPAVLNEALLRSIILVLDVVERQGLASSISELDFRTGTVVYRVKEGVSG